MTNSPPASLQFLGAAGGVTGSKYLFSYGDDQLLIDCGLFQGLKELRQRNWAPVPIDLARLRGVILTHAHIDHSGYLPRIVAQGYRGPVFATPGTCDLLKVMLPDSAYLQEEEARYANRNGYSKHRPAFRSIPCKTPNALYNSCDRFEMRNPWKLCRTYRSVSAGSVIFSAQAPRVCHSK